MSDSEGSSSSSAYEDEYARSSASEDEGGGVEERGAAAGGDQRDAPETQPTRTGGLKLKLNVRPPGGLATPARGEDSTPQRKRMRMDDEGSTTPASGSKIGTGSSSGSGLKLKLNVRPAGSPAVVQQHEQYTDDSATTMTPVPSRSIKLKLGGLGGAVSATPLSSGPSTPATAPRSHKAKNKSTSKSKSKSHKKKAPTLASPYPSPGGSPGGTPSPAVRVVKSGQARAARHPLASEVHAGGEEEDGADDGYADRQLSRTPGPGTTRGTSAAPASAVPAYLQPSTGIHSESPDSSPATPSRSPSTPAVKLEDEEDDPMNGTYDSPAAYGDGEGEQAAGDAPQEVHWNTKGQKGRPYLRIKRPLREIVKRILVDLRRKDQYGLFLDPVSEQEYPGYTAAIGGPDQAMDLSTIERKAEDRVYQSIDDFAADIDKMVAAAKRFNGDDSFPAHEADIVKALSDKLVDRYANVIRSPSPERERASTVVSTGNTGTGTRLGTPAAGRSVSPSVPPPAPTQAILRPVVPPRSTIPEAMLEFPPESLAAAVVGYYLTGGKRQRTKKEARGRERWDEGTWREWHVEGDRNLREAEDASVVMDTFRSKMFEHPDVVRWSAYRKPTDDEVPPIPTRTAEHLDYGRLQDLDDKPVLRHDGPWEHVRRVTLGKQQTDEAYLRSIDAFIGGAERSVGRDRPGHLHDYAHREWRGGFVDSELRQLVNEIGREFTTPSAGPVTELVQDSRQRLPILKELQTWAAKGAGVDLACLLHEPSDFSVGTAPGPGAGAARAAWFERALRQAGEQIQAASERLQQGKLGEDEQAKLKQLRLHLLSLVKNVPVYELRPMTPAEAAKLPEAVRGLIKIIK